MLYFIKKRKIIGKVEDMPPFQYELYLEDGWKRCDKDGNLVEDKDDVADYKEQAKILAKAEDAEKKRIADAKKAEKAKKVAELKKIVDAKAEAAKAKAAEALRVANLELEKAKKTVK